MLMSDLIVLGSTLRPQCKRVLFDGIGSCANGAALEALGYNLSDVMMCHNVYWRTALSCGNLAIGRSITEIGKLNDSGHTRQYIAQWLVESGNDFEVTPLPWKTLRFAQNEVHAGGELAVTT